MFSTRASLGKIESAQVRRLSFLLILLFILLGVAGMRLFQKSVVEHAKYTAMAMKQRVVQKELPANRGKIYVQETNGELYPLATNITLNTLEIIPNHIKNAEELAQKVAPIIGLDEKEFLKTITTDKLYIPPIKKRLTPTESKAIEDLDLDGVILVPEEYRYYPEGSLASNVLGFVDAEKKGHYGIEEYFDSRLKGKWGTIATEKDSAGRQISVGTTEFSQPKDGDSIVLTIDRAIQFKVEKQLAEAVKKNKADSGSVVVMEPKTGRILAMASYPTYNPNKYNKVKEYGVFINQAITDIYEPGSVFKPLVMAAAINEKLVEPTTEHRFGAYVEVQGQKINTALKRAYGLETMTQVLENSDNVAMVWIQQKLGKEKMYEYLDRYGFGTRSGIELAQESAGRITSKKYATELDLATMSFGQGIAVTPLQLATACAALTNGGKLVKPYIVEKIITADGTEERTKPKEIRRVVEEDTARKIDEMMVSVVVNGHGKPAKVAGYNVGGKTGTAQVATKTGYSASKHTGSFLGFAPLEDPAFSMITKLDNPRAVQWAEFSAAPLFGQIADWLLKYLMIPPTK